MEAYNGALQLNPMFAAAHSNVANVYREQGRMTQALEHYQYVRILACMCSVWPGLRCS